MKIKEKNSLSIENFWKSEKRNIVRMKVFAIFIKAKTLSIFLFFKIKIIKLIEKTKTIKK
jgi:hypothetical protein